MDGLAYTAFSLLDSLDRSLQGLAQSTGFFQGNRIADYVLALIIGALFPVGRWIVDSLVYDRLGRRLLKIPPKEAGKDERARYDQLVTLKKFKESFYKVGVQLTFTAVLAVVALRAPWARDTRHLWSECWGLPCEAPVSLGERFIYCLELGFYTQAGARLLRRFIGDRGCSRCRDAIPMLFLWETKRKDRWEVLAHHIATIVLIGYSYWLNLTRVGVMVLVCHEANDIFLEASARGGHVGGRAKCALVPLRPPRLSARLQAAKMARYADNEAASTGFFVAFLVTWIATRVLAFPLIVIRSTLYESWRAEWLQGHFNGTHPSGATTAREMVQPHWAILNGFLGFLYLLHVYWTYLILRIVVKRLTGGKLDDIREGEEGEVPPPKAKAEPPEEQQPAAEAAAAGSALKQRRRLSVAAGSAAPPHVPGAL
eukprot:scaffold4.g4573.t1